MRRSEQGVRKAWQALATRASGDERSNLIDLMKDLMHWCDDQQVDFDEALSLATDYYSEERETP